MTQSKKPVTEPQSKRITEDASDNILKKMWELVGSVENLGTKLEMKVKNLEEMDYEDLEEKVRGRDRQEGGRFQERRKRKIARSQVKRQS